MSGRHRAMNLVRTLPLVRIAARRLLSTTSKRDDVIYCDNVVRSSNLDAYLASTLWPKSLVPSYMSIIALQSEVSSVKVNARGNQQHGRMRLKWWKQIVGQIFAGELDPKDIPSPVLRQLHETHKQHQLTERYVTRILEAQDDALGSIQFETIDEAETKMENLCSSVHYLLLEILNCRDDSSAMVASHCGVGNGLVQLLLNAAVAARVEVCNAS